MKTSAHGLALIKQFESLHKVRRDGMVEAYLCPERKPTIGWGCTKGVKLGDVLTVAQCEARLAAELPEYETAINESIHVPLNQNQFDALVSFTWNVGTGWINGKRKGGAATFVRLLNAGDYSAVPRELLKFSRGNKSKKKYDSLAARRKIEGQLWLKPISVSAKTNSATENASNDNELEISVTDFPKKSMPQDVAPEETPLRKVSRKFQLLDLLKWLFGISALGTGGTISAGNIEATKVYADQIMAMVSSYGVPGLIVICVGGYVAVQAVQYLMEEDRAKGSYTPSGEIEV